MAKFESAKGFGTAFIPVLLKLVFHALDGKTKNRNNTLLLMGKSQTDQLEFPSTATLAFGSWINSNHPYPQNATFASLKRNYSLQEMSGLYGALTDSTFLPFTNASLLARCTNKSNPFLSKDCGLAINLGIYADPNVHQNVTLLVAPWIQSFLCPNALSCYNTTNNSAAIVAVAAFIAGPLPRFVLQYWENNNNGLTTTRNQAEIILGYSIPSVIRVSGPVTSYNNEAEAKTQEKNSTFYTCESTKRRFTYAGKGWGKRETGGGPAVQGGGIRDRDGRGKGESGRYSSKKVVIGRNTRETAQQCLLFGNRKKPTKRKSMKRAGAGARNASYGMQEV